MVVRRRRQRVACGGLAVEEFFSAEFVASVFGVHGSGVFGMRGLQADLTGDFLHWFTAALGDGLVFVDEDGASAGHAFVCRHRV